MSGGRVLLRGKLAEDRAARGTLRSGGVAVTVEGLTRARLRLDLPIRQVGSFEAGSDGEMDGVNRGAEWCRPYWINQPRQKSAAPFQTTSRRSIPKLRRQVTVVIWG
jgi:hypothetical protein